jgi:hypothetical protein
MNPPISARSAAEGLREEAASCRLLARRARTASGSIALNHLADQFDTDARRLDPCSERR